jgi:hypothetical protein
MGIQARGSSRTWATPGNKGLTALKLKSEAKPRHRPPNRTFRYFAFASSEAIVDYVDKSGLAGLRRARDDVHGANLQ